MMNNMYRSKHRGSLGFESIQKQMSVKYMFSVCFDTAFLGMGTLWGPWFFPGA